MKKIFTIGEVSKIYGISVHSLRHYHKINLIVPSYIDENTGYRYYTFEQFQFLSRLKYLRSIGLSLEQIKEVFNSGDACVLKRILNEIKNDKEKEIFQIKDIINKIDWIQSYYSFSQNNDLLNLVYKRDFKERHILTSSVNDKISIEEMDIDLHKKLNSNKFKNLNYTRQFGYILDFESLIKGSFKPKCVTLFINELPNFKSDNIATLPKGAYLCYCTKLLTKDFDITPVVNYVKQKPKTNPKAVIALEFEEHLKEYYNALYEIQILF